MQNNNMFIPTFNNDSAYRQALQGIPVFNQPVYNPQPVIQQPVQPQLTPEQIAYIRAQQNQPVVNPQAEQLKQSWLSKPIEFQGHPILSNAATMAREWFIGDPLQIGTGVVSAVGEAINDPIGTLQRAGQDLHNYANDLYYRSEPQLTGNRVQDKINQLLSPIRYGANIGKDAYNFMYGNTLPLIHTRTLGEMANAIKSGDSDRAYQIAKEAGIQSLEQIKNDPLITAMIFAPNLTSRQLGRQTKAVLNTAEKMGVPVGEVSQNVAKAIQAIDSKFTKENLKLEKMAEDFKKVSDEDLVTVMRHHLKGTPLPDNLENLSEKFIEWNNEYKKTYKDNALMNPNHLAALQYVQSETGKTIQELRRELAPHLEALQEGVTNPSLKFTNRLENFRIDLEKLKKNNKEFLKNSKKISELSEDEITALSKHFDNAELTGLRSIDATVKEAKQYLGDITRDAWEPKKISEAVLKDTRFQENMAKLAGLAESTGNQTLKHFYDGMKLANEGKIRPFTFAGAEIPESGLVSNEGRRFQGRSSSREYGTATYEDIAKAYKDIHHFLDDVTLQRVKEEIAENIFDTGTIDGINKLVGDNVKAKDIKYLNPELVSAGKIAEAVKTASNTAVEGAIPIDKYNLNAMNNLLSSSASPFAKGALRDVYNLFKEAALASGTYLGGNFASGAFGTMLNSGSPQGLIKDIVSAIGSKGALSKELGTFRPIKPADRRYATKGAQIISKIGRWVGSGVAPRIDAAMQNMFSEINAHAYLRKEGLKPSSIANLDKVRLADFINNVRKYSMMNTKYRVIPRGAIRDTLSVANPFIDWIDTSTQVTAQMLMDHPVLMGAVAAKLFGDIAFDKELQNRLKLGVYTDRPLVTYKADSNSPTGVKEISVNFLPQLTPLEFLANPTKLLTGTSGAPVLGAIYEASKGKTPYGNPMRRSHAQDEIMSVVGGTRYVTNPKTGALEPITKTMGDEMLSTAIKNTIAPVGMINKTVAPIITDIYSGIKGEDINWHMPYGQSIFGSLTTGQPEKGELSSNILYTGDPARPRHISDIVKGLGTYYERDYYPQGQMTGNQIRRVRRAGVRQGMREYARGEE